MKAKIISDKKAPDSVNFILESSSYPPQHSKRLLEPIETCEAIKSNNNEAKTAPKTCIKT